MKEDELEVYTFRFTRKVVITHQDYNGLQGAEGNLLNFVAICERYTTLNYYCPHGLCMCWLTPEILSSVLILPLPHASIHFGCRKKQLPLQS